MAPPLYKTSPRTPSYLYPLVIALSLFTLTALLLYKVDNFVSQTKTVVGHNLEPTPWHQFPAKTFEEETRHGRAYKIIHCSYLTCRHRNDNPKERLRAPSGSNQTTTMCPEFFGAIHRDLQPWVATKISNAHLVEAQKYAAFRVIIVGGKLYVDLYYACVQSRAMFTIWSFLQLLRRYPGIVPDVDMMFDCMDKPTINRTEHQSMPLPLFRYCTTVEHFDIPFPDWSFWGWSEINVRPWHVEFPDIKLGSTALTWEQKIPIAYWKGNPDVASPVRTELLNCNDTMVWGAQIMRQDWKKAAKTGFKESKLSSQCKHQYKIYAEGYAWSVSLKYILACGSVALIISPQYQDFFSRGLIPQNNFWLVDALDLCPSIKRAVDWGNDHPAEAEAMGRRGQELMETLNMDRVYDYMFHLISEYAKLQDFKPNPPSTAMEVCAESVLCYADEKQTAFLKQSAASPSQAPPCTLPPPAKTG
ncbi:O-glucosyltransferase rumi-like protein [Senna tora]|uniref:O-glucosyltransferase rumi-like protein n=1 Tax=Senna tora TaxID=362788 RepID=A0A834WWG6_9FABA|nr:O-glucosyltransferase rumi-like protein [Senna tora]